jgi:NAD(P)H-quinone oxidoreductase subunit L
VIGSISLKINIMYITLLLYAALAGAYLLVVPALTYAYLNNRWYVASSLERGFMYFMLSFFFPGMLLLAPFLNFRPKRRQIAA